MSIMATQDVFDRVLERWSLQPEDLDVGPLVLGAGSFGEVRAGTLRDGNCSIPVAVKLLPMNGNSEETWNKIGAEAVLLAKVSERCKSTSRLYGICRKDDKFCLVMKKYVTSLEKKINEYPDRKAPRKKVERWAVDICQAVAELHAQNVIFRDLKPSNVLLDEYDGAILADFGISKMVERTVAQHQTSSTVAGTFAYMAPEMFSARAEERSSKVDVWSLGCLLLELHTGKAPWQGLDVANILCQVLSLRGHPSIPLEMNRDLLDVLEQCFVYDPAERASAMAILEALKIAYCQAPERLTNFEEKCRIRDYSGSLATCLQCTSKLSMQHDTSASSDFMGRIESLDREVEALTLQKDEAESRLFASEEKVEKLKRVNEDVKWELATAVQWKKEKAVLERRLAQFERRNAQLLEQTSELTEVVASFDEQKHALEEAEAQLFAANGEVEELKAENEDQKRQLDATARGDKQMASKNTLLEGKVAHHEIVNAQLLKQVTDLQQDKARLEHAEYEARSQKLRVEELVAEEASLKDATMAGDDGSVTNILNKSEWEAKLEDAKTRNKIVVVHFYNVDLEGCGIISRIFLEQSKKYKNNLIFLEAKINKVPNVATKWGIILRNYHGGFYGSHTFLFIDNGKKIDKIITVNRDELEKKIHHYATNQPILKKDAPEKAPDKPPELKT